MSLTSAANHVRTAFAWAIVLILVVASPASAEVPPPFILEWGTNGSGDGQFNGPNDVAVDSVGYVYVGDRGNFRIQKFDSNGNFLRMWGFGVDDGSGVFQICTSSCQAGISGSGAGQFQAIDFLDVGPDGNIYVTDDQLGRIQVFDSDGNFVRQWPTAQSPPIGQMNNPIGIGIDQNTGDVYVSLGGSLTGPYTVEKYDAFGNLQVGWGVGGAISNPGVNTAPGFLNRPIGVAVDSLGDVYVVDHQAPLCCFSRVQVFSGSTGAFLLQIGSTGTGDGQFINAIGVAIDSADNVYVTEWGGDRVQKFTSAGVFLTKWGSLGSGQGQFNRPSGLDVDSNYNVYVADILNHRIQKFGFLGFGLNFIETLVTDGVLNQGQGDALTVKLEGVIKKLDKGNVNAAINQLEAFINQVYALINAGVLSPAEGTPLIDAASAIISQLSLP